MNNKIIELETHLEKSSPLYLGYDMDQFLFEKINEMNPDKIFFITDTTLYKIHGKGMCDKLRKEHNTHLILIGNGELSKNIFTLNCICEKMFEKMVSKDSLLIAFGGGIVGNITGLSAALIYRGIPFIEIPTTFLAQTDSVLSNKQAVNSSFGKNMLGVYYQPKFILVDTKYLRTEPRRFLYSGMVETVKNALISDRNLFKMMYEALKDDDISENKELLFEIAKISIESKINILKKDPSEKKYCMILEYGHTFGHAIETLLYGTYTHGEAISIGMIIAAHISNLMGYITEEEVKLHYEIFNKMNMPVRLPNEIQISDIMRVIQNDNKRKGCGVVFVLLESIGVPLKQNNEYLVQVPDHILDEALKIVQENRIAESV